MFRIPAGNRPIVLNQSTLCCHLASAFVVRTTLPCSCSVVTALRGMQTRSSDENSVRPSVYQTRAIINTAM